MRIAITYENGEVFQHFGRTENFKVFEVENNEIISSQIISSNECRQSSPKLSSVILREPL